MRLSGSVSRRASEAASLLNGERLSGSEAVACLIRRIETPEVAVGVDVGEDFLDLAVLRAKSLVHFRIPLRGIEDDPLRILCKRLSDCCPDCDPRWLVLIDSPRWPRDLDCASRGVIRRDPVPSSRMLDRSLREMLRASAEHAALRLSMFPTPEMDYFRRCASSLACKPHLRSIYRNLFASASGASTPVRPVSGPVPGGVFTRFMLAGFLTFRAWDALGARTLEAYPELQFRLCKRRLLPKRVGKAGLAQRIAVNRKLRCIVGVVRSPTANGFDQADAEVLAMSAKAAGRHGCLASLEHPAEGRFLITFNSAIALS